MLSLLAGTLVAATSTPSDLGIDWQLGHLQIVAVSLAVGYVAAVRPPLIAATVGLLAAAAARRHHLYTSGTDQFAAAVGFLLAALRPEVGYSVRARRVHAQLMRAQSPGSRRRRALRSPASCTTRSPTASV